MMAPAPFLHHVSPRREAGAVPWAPGTGERFPRGLCQSRPCWQILELCLEALRFSIRNSWPGRFGVLQPLPEASPPPRSPGAPRRRGAGPRAHGFGSAGRQPGPVVMRTRSPRGSGAAPAAPCSPPRNPSDSQLCFQNSLGERETLQEPAGRGGGEAGLCKTHVSVLGLRRAFWGGRRQRGPWGRLPPILQELRAPRQALQDSARPSPAQGARR